MTTEEFDIINDEMVINDLSFFDELYNTLKEYPKVVETVNAAISDNAEMVLLLFGIEMGMLYERKYGKTLDK